MEPVLLLSHKYDLRAPLQLCTEFLAQHFTTSAYTKLDSSQLARLPALLALTRQLELTSLHSSIMSCLADNLSKLSAKSRSFSASSLGLRCKTKQCRTPYGCRELGTNPSFAIVCDTCKKEITPPPEVSMVEPAEPSLFSKIWKVPETMLNRAFGCMTQQQILSALQSQLQPQEVMQLLAMLVGVPSMT